MAKQIKLMIVDDSRTMRTTIANIAAHIPGLEIVGEAGNGADALPVYKKIMPHVVTMDLTMPRMNGVETIENIIAHDPKARILVVSSLNDLNTALKAIEAGAQGFLHKPFSPDELCNKLKEILL